MAGSGKHYIFGKNAGQYLELLPGGEHLRVLRAAFSHVSHRFTLVLAFLGSLLVGVVWFFVLGLCFVFVFVLGGSLRFRDVVVFFPTS